MVVSLRAFHRRWRKPHKSEVGREALFAIALVDFVEVGAVGQITAAVRAVPIRLMLGCMVMSGRIVLPVPDHGMIMPAHCNVAFCIMQADGR